MVRRFNRPWALVVLLPIVAASYVAVLLAMTQSADAYVTIGRWENGRKTIYWNTRFTCTGGNGEFPASTRCEIRGGAGQVYVTSNDFSVAGWGANPAAVNLTWGSTGIKFADEYFNTDWNWNDEQDGTCIVNRDTRVADIRPVHNHEAGHWIALNENGGNTDAERNALMHVDGRCKLNSNSDDDAGVRALYP